MTTITDIRGRVRTDLHDEDPQNYRWTDAELDRHIDRAVNELSLAVPLEAKTTLTTAAGSRDISIASLSDRVAVEAVEYPAGKYPPVYVRFSIWMDTLTMTMLIDGAPGAGENVDVHYARPHTLDTAGSTVPPPLEELVSTGAAGYAALEWASFATNRVNVGGEGVWRQYLAWGQDRISAFLRGLAERGRRNSVRARSLYTPSRLPEDKTRVIGP